MRRHIEQAGLTELIEVESAGASSEHAGQAPDRRALADADARGIDLRGIRARKMSRDDWSRFDLILVADELVEQSLARRAPDEASRAKLHRMTAFGPDAAALDEVPDPYYGGPDGFELVYGVLERACAGLLDHVRNQLLQPQ
jgi:protein-tyrosine phosphatase